MLDAADQASKTMDHAAANPIGRDAGREVPDAESLSERALTVIRCAEGRIRVLDAGLDRSVQAIVTRSACAIAATVAATVLPLTAAAGLFNTSDPHPLFLACAGLGFVSLLVACLGEAPRSGTRRQAVDLSNQVGSARQLIRAGRRVQNALASCLREEPSAESRAMILVLVRWLESEKAAFSEGEGSVSVELGLGTRRHERIVPRTVRTTVSVPDGRILAARIADLSMSGVAIETELTGVPLGTVVTIGRQRARAVRILARGMAFEFEKSLDPLAFDAGIIL